MVATGMDTRADPLPAVFGRARELARLTGLVDRAREGHGSAVVLLGEAGSGRTALLDALHPAAPATRVLDTCGVGSESALPFAGLHRLLLSMPTDVSRLPPPLRRSLAPALGPTGPTGPASGIDDFGLHAAFHHLLTESAEPNSVTVCRVDDAHLLDHASLSALAFTARRLAGTRTVLVFTAEQGPEWTGADLLDRIPRLRLRALDDDAAEAILRDRLPYDLGSERSGQLLDLCCGNPLALTEVAEALDIEGAGALTALPRSLPANSRLRRSVRRRLLRLSSDARRVVAMVAADGALDLDVLLSASAKAGIAPDGLDEGRQAGLLVVTDGVVRVRGRLLDGVLRAELDLGEAQEAHRLLTDVANPETDRYRWTWHRAALASTDAAGIATELDHAAALARESHDYLASSRASERAAVLGAPGEERARRLISASADYWAAGRPRRCRALLREAEPLARSAGLRGAAALLNGEIELRSGSPAAAASDLLVTARQFAGTHRSLAVETLVLAGEANCVAGDNAGYCATAEDAARLRTSDEAPATGLVLDHFAGMAATFRGEHGKAEGALRRVVAFADATDHPVAKILASQAAYTLGESSTAHELALRAVTHARATGDQTQVPWAMVYASLAALLSDRYSAAASSSLEGLRTAQALGQRNCAIDHLCILALLSALQGDHETAAVRLDAAAHGVAERGLGRPSAFGSWAAACADLAVGRPADALDRLRLLSSGENHRYSSIRAMAIPHFVEAAVRCGERRRAERALGSFDSWAGSTGGPARRALAHRCHALLADSATAAAEHYLEAIRLHRNSNTSFELARTELFYAHQLRRDRKPGQAREYLRESLKIFQGAGARYWVHRTQAELRACGDPVRGESSPATTDLTPQQSEISRLVAEGATNREIATQLFISHRTVDYHLRNIFAKLGVRSRVELAKLFR
ncbi:helix-turn-helix transcriptional regulator [Amycolatopsis marina]|nr:LuxR family transcriptional regulator [Amycolatopsis marina]